jgi:hypothetical protein
MRSQPELYDWIIQQIDAAEHQARAAAEFQALEWSCPSTGVVDLGAELIATGDRDVAYHIVRHDPAAVLRRCAADRKILEHHRPTPCGAFGCDCGNRCATCDWTESQEKGEEARWGSPDLHFYPCPTARALAMAVADGYKLGETASVMRHT